MLQPFEVFSSFIAYLIIIGFAIFTGYFLELVFRKKLANDENRGSFSIFWSLFIGTLSIISVYAILLTKGQTIFLITPLLIFLLLRQNITTVKFSKEDKKQNIIFFVCSVMLNFLFYYWALHSFNPNKVIFVSADFNIYFRTAQFFNDFCIENASLNPINKAQFAAPYHYGDIWMYAILSRFVSTNPSVVYLIAFAHFSVIFINGVYYYIKSLFANSLKGNEIYLYILLFAGLFTGFDFFFPKFILRNADPYTLSVMNWAKVLVPSCTLIALLGLAQSRKWFAMAIVAMIGGLAFINALPAVFMAMFFLFTVLLLSKQISFKHWLFINSFYVIITSIFVVLFYKVWPSLIGVEVPKGSNGLDMINTIDLKKYLKTAMNIFLGGWFQMFVLAPFGILLLIGVLISVKTKDIWKLLLKIDKSIIFLFFIIFSGLICWAILHNFDVNSVQFYSNVLSPFSVIIISIMLFYIIYIVKNRILILLFIILCFTSIYNHKDDIFFATNIDSTEWKSMKTYFSTKTNNSRFVSIKTHNSFNNFFEKYTTIFIPLNVLNYLWPDYQNFSLNAPFITIEKENVFHEEVTTAINSAPFMIYYQANIAKMKHDDIALNFIKENQVGYISVAMDTVLPLYLRPLVKDSLLLEKSNFVVYRVK